MNITAITTNFNGERYNQFLKNNSHLEIKSFEAILGNDLSHDEVLTQNLATSQLISHKGFFSPGAIGCGASHRAIWRNCIKEQKNFLVLEDDCYTHPKIMEYIQANKKNLDSCDICYFGLHTDSVIKLKSPEGLQFSSIYFDPPYPEPEWIRSYFYKTDIKKIILNKLIIGFGTWAYFLTPKGARKLDDLIFPLSLKKTPIPLIDNGRTKDMPCTSIDRSACSIYEKIDAFITYPFLALNPNKDISTTETSHPKKISYNFQK